MRHLWVVPERHRTFCQWGWEYHLVGNNRVLEESVECIIIKMWENCAGTPASKEKL